MPLPDKSATIDMGKAMGIGRAHALKRNLRGTSVGAYAMEFWETIEALTTGEN